MIVKRGESEETDSEIRAVELLKCPVAFKAEGAAALLLGYALRGSKQSVGCMKKRFATLILLPTSR